MPKQEIKMYLNGGWQFRGELSIYFASCGELTHCGTVYHSLTSFQSHEGEEKDYFLQLRGEVWEPAGAGAVALMDTVIAKIIFSQAGDKEVAKVIVNNPEIRKNVLTGKFIEFAIQTVKEFLENEMTVAKPNRKKALHDLIFLQAAILRKLKRRNKVIAKLTSIWDDIHHHPDVKKAFDCLEKELSKVMPAANDIQPDSGGANE